MLYLRGHLCFNFVCICKLKFIIFFCKRDHCAHKLANLAFFHKEEHKWFYILPSYIYLYFFFIIVIVCLCFMKYNIYYKFSVVPHVLYAFILFFIFNKFLYDNKWLIDFGVLAKISKFTLMSIMNLFEKKNIKEKQFFFT